MTRPPADMVGRSATADPDRPRDVFWMLARIIVLAIIGAGLFVIHGAAFHLNPWSQVVINAIIGYKYPKTGQEDTTVLLFTEDNLDWLKGSFPVSYDLHAQVLKALSQSVHRPRALFVDFAFVEKRSDQKIAPLHEAICRLTGLGTPVYLALPPLPPHPSEDQKQAAKIRDELLTCDKGMPKAEAVSAQMESEYGVSGVLEYKDCTNTALGLKLSPAFAMLREEVPACDPPRPMEIIWGSGKAPLINTKWLCLSDKPDETAPPGRADGFARLAERFPFVHALRKGPLSAKQTCPYTRTISVRHLLESAPDDPDPDVVEALRDKTVLYGGGFLMASDTVVSPVYGDLPAVYLHAMAYDNLRTFGPDYKRAAPRTNALLDYILLLLISAVLVVASSGTLKQLPRPNPSFRWLALTLATAWMVLAWHYVSLVPRSGWEKVLSAVFLVLPLSLVGAFALLGPAADAARHSTNAGAPEQQMHERAEFLRRCLLTLISVPVAIIAVLAMDGVAGLRASVLVALLCYVVYKLLVANDLLFVFTVLLLVIASFVSWLLNLGPRNIVAYLLFFEVARHLIKHLDDAAAEYVRVRGDQPHVFWDWVFRLCRC